ncbi:L,D-transpeptidase [Rhizobium oryzicola]|uniref:L,D-transpeptidase n=1 Tax=Rhizobium oryzicola TaxID=1232668 RepID=A0ABT8SRV7_9HYPH|nr:L,D-transpeptidase [Rhizobium oryzicola]MDO1581147.1 L,D-transpeptidase [Rhizobium oryzicola]
MKKILLLTAALSSLCCGHAMAQDRYQERPPVIVSPDLAAPWIMQLGGNVRTPQGYAVQPAQPRAYYRPQAAYQPRVAPALQPVYAAPRTQSTQIRPAQPAPRAPVQQASMQRLPVIKGQVEPQFLPQMVSYDSKYEPGTIVIDTNNRFLYLVMDNGQAKRYGVGVGKPGFEWAGTHTVTRKAEWPDWHPPKEMIEREAAKGHFLPVSMPGGEENPLGARAMYLGSTLYRIHGTNAPWTIGSAVSSGCIRMRNEDVIDLYGRVKVGTKVIVI